MTSVEIDRLGAGRELDKLIATSVMRFSAPLPDDEFEPSTTDMQAVVVWAKYPGLKIAPSRSGDWRAWGPGQRTGEDDPFVIAPTFPLAVCRAVLKIVFDVDY